jgi:hypothetical protein
MADSDNERFYIDRRISLTLIFVGWICVAVVVWWAATLTKRVEQLEKQAAAMAPQDTRLTRVEVRLDNVVDGISEIKALLRPPVPIVPK